MEISENTVKVNSYTPNTTFDTGIWLFFLIELVLFGGWFILYAVGKPAYTVEFKLAAMNMNSGLGLLNTILLATSSLILSTGYKGLLNNNRYLAVFGIWLSSIMAIVFFIGRIAELYSVYELGGVQSLFELMNAESGEIAYYGLFYFTMLTHIVLLLIGFVLIKFVVAGLSEKKFRNANTTHYEKASIYWHMVTLVGILFYPLFYLFH